MSLLNAIVVRTRARLASEDGFTLIEMLNVMMILGILMSISFSAYTTLHTRAEQKAAVANVSAVLPALAAWRSDHAGSYFGIDMSHLNADYLEGTLDITYYDVVSTDSDTNYCIQYTVPTGDYTAKAVGPEGTITVGSGNIC
jgi:prepilin-type N-terminal cleavage/methylation domain-containing protein